MTARLDDEAQTLYLNNLIEAGYKILYSTSHFGKAYIWLKAPDGSALMERVPPALLETTEESNE